jgi:hypothetical protein
MMKSDCILLLIAYCGAGWEFWIRPSMKPLDGFLHVLGSHIRFFFFPSAGWAKTGRWCNDMLSLVLGNSMRVLMHAAIFALVNHANPIALLDTQRSGRWMDGSSKVDVVT